MTFFRWVLEPQRTHDFYAYAVTIGSFDLFQMQLQLASLKKLFEAILCVT